MTDVAGGPESELHTLTMMLQLEHVRAVKENRLANNKDVVDRIIDLIGSERAAINLIATVEAASFLDLANQTGNDAEVLLQQAAIEGFTAR